MKAAIGKTAKESRQTGSTDSSTTTAIHSHTNAGGAGGLSWIMSSGRSGLFHGMLARPDGGRENSGTS